MYTKFWFFLSKKWVKNRGTNQGCPLSPSLYLLTAEIMANKLRNNPKIKGLKVNEVEYLISQFADDTDLYLSYDQETVTSTIDTLSDIEKNTGLQVSYDKTTMYRIGSLHKSNARLVTQRKITWANNHINMLGVNISNDRDTVCDNISDVIQKMKAIASMWYYRNMSLFGKVLIINSLMASLFVYRMQAVDLIREKDILEVENVMENFLWKGKRAKMNLAVLKRNKNDGGLGLIDIRTKHEALLYNWVVDSKYNANIKNMMDGFLGLDSELLWECNLTGKDSKKYIPGNTFWHNLIHRWNNFNYHKPQNAEMIREQIICFNSFIKKNGNVIKDKKWRSDYIMRIKDLLRPVGNEFMSYDEILIKYPTAAFNWLEHTAIISAIPDDWKTKLRERNSETFTTRYSKLGDNVKVSQMFYKDIMSSNCNLEKCKEIWRRKGMLEEDIESFRKHFKNIYDLTDMVKLRDFQFRLLHNKIFCNDILVHWRKVDSNVCNFCKVEKQTIVHLMYRCPVVQQVWQTLELKLIQFPCDFNTRSVLFNLVINNKTSHVINFIVLITKQYIFRCKCYDVIPSVNQLFSEIANIRRVELCNSWSSGSSTKVYNKWRPVKNIF